MTEVEMDVAHELLEAYQEAVVVVGKAIILSVTEDQQRYIINRMNDEFRFWRLL